MDGVFVSLNELCDHAPQQLHLLWCTRRHWWTEISQVVFGLLGLGPDLLHDLRQVVLDVREQDLGQLGRQVADTQQALRHRGVYRMSAEVELLLLDGRLDGDSVQDVLLGPVLDSDEPETERHIFTLDHPLGVGTPVHDINLGDNTNSTDTLWVHLSRHLQTVRRRHIGIRWKHAEDDGP